MKRLLILLAFTFSFSSHATAIYLEPYLGYHVNAEFKFSGGSETASGLTYGGRFGGDSMGFLFGLDYMTGSWSSSRNNITPSNIGVFAGYVFPAMMKAYVTYFFDEKYKFGSTDLGGTEFKLGVAMTTLPVITLGIEYAFGTLTKSNGSAMSDVKVSYFGLVVGVPFEFGGG